MLKLSSGVVGGFAAALMALISGCAVNPIASHADHKSISERDLLADAAREVEFAPWPKPQSVSFVSRITGADDEDRITRSEAIEIYLEGLEPAGQRFTKLAQDAHSNLIAADRLAFIAQNALASPRLTKNDVSTVETAIKALRENRQIYINAAKQIEKSGEPIAPEEIDAIRTAYSDAIRKLGKTADALADQIDNDHSATVAQPAPRYQKDLSGV
ncbi:hypothetical protein [Hyphococcus sp. DH-69]|uniref:hypothetical protein n=1 Tax=Hyphococcus formosus TaxID=3143534 RepID=UPI00398BB15B